ncbi:MAG: hypothetical protein O2800_06115 [Planctomycetota bacterium]|nr:hypothetical protein [Planctomycetota bacterium]
MALAFAVVPCYPLVAVFGSALGAFRYRVARRNAQVWSARVALTAAIVGIVMGIGSSIATARITTLLESDAQAVSRMEIEQRLTQAQVNSIGPHLTTELGEPRTLTFTRCTLESGGGLLLRFRSNWLLEGPNGTGLVETTGVLSPSLGSFFPVPSVQTMSIQWKSGDVESIDLENHPPN